jgi:hypothetical protein
MLRQAKFSHEEKWTDYPDCTLFGAVRSHAVKTDMPLPATVQVMVRCAETPELPMDGYNVLVSLHAEVLNPRKGNA